MRQKLTFVVIGMLMTLPNVAHSAVLGGISSSSFLTADLEVSLLGGGAAVDGDLTVGPSVAGTAPTAYSFDQEVLNVSASAGINPLITAIGVGSSSVDVLASSTVDGGLGSRNATGNQLIEDFDLSIGELPVLADVLSITADAITVSSVVDGDFGALSPVGTMNVTNFRVFVNGAQVGALLNGDITADFDFGLSTFLGGATLTLNEQNIVGDGISSSSLETNAINLQLINVGVPAVGAIDGNVLVGLTGASLQASAVPEPSSLAILSAASLGGVFWRRRRVVSPAC
ncbi:PEP-CTERM sorting domain-containing protein [Rhodopirellula bahusiensis]